MKNPKSHHRNLLILVPILFFLLSACNRENGTPTPAATAITAELAAATETPEPPTNTPTPEPTDPPPTETATPFPTETPAPTATPTQTPLEIAQAATVRIVAQGSEYLETLIGSGSGVIYDSSGLVLTTNHLVEGAGLVQVSVEDREESLTAQVVGRSACDNLAVLKLLGSEFPAVSIGNSDALEERVHLIGYPAGETAQVTENNELVTLEPSTTLSPTGFSAVTGTIFLESGVDSGFSGAPMVTADGRFTGLVTYPGSGAELALVLALPQIRPVLELLEQGENLNWIGVNAGVITAEQAAEIGIEIQPGIFVYAVDFRGPAGTADLRSGDIITEMGGSDLTGEDGFARFCAALRNFNEGDSLDLAVLRTGTRLVGQINGDPLAEEVVVEAPAEETGDNSAPGSGDARSTLLAVIQATDVDMRSLGGTIDSLATNGCLGPQFLAGSANDDGPGSAGPATDTQAHPGCIHNISDCQLILDRYNRITNPPAIDLSSASQEVLDANSTLQAAIVRFDSGATPLVEACRAFVNDPNLTINSLAFGLARQGADEALIILAPALQALQG